MTAKSRVIVNTGHGKGKTTAALGIVMRAVARDWKVCVVQFIKSGRWKVGEEKVARELGVDWWSIGDGFTWESTDMDATEATARAAWEAAKQKIAAGTYDVVLLDEITYPINFGWIEAAEVGEVIRNRPPNVNVIATGRDAPAELVEVADTVTEMVAIRHAFDSGIPGRRGIEF